MQEVNSTIDLVDFVGYYRFKYTFERLALALIYIGVIVVSVIVGSVVMRFNWKLSIPIYAICIVDILIWRAYNFKCFDMMFPRFEKEKLGKELNLQFTHDGIRYAIGSPRYQMVKYEKLHKVRETRYFIFIWTKAIEDDDTPIMIHKSRIEARELSKHGKVYPITEIKEKCRDYKKSRATELTVVPKGYKQYFVPL